VAGGKVATAADTERVKFLDSLQTESDVRRDETNVSDADLNIRFLRGQQWPDIAMNLGGRRAETNQFRYVMNVVKTTIQRKVSLITDARPQINVMSRSSRKWQKASDAVKQYCAYVWDEEQMDQNSARELVRAGTLGSTCAVPIWDQKANYGRGDIRILWYDPRNIALDPSVTRATDMKTAEYFQCWDIAPLNWVRESYVERGAEVQPSMEWSSYETPKARRSGYSGVQTPLAQPWRRNRAETETSVTPRCRIRHTWFRDWQRDDKKGDPVWTLPRVIRHMVDASGIVLIDEPMPFTHQQLPGHLFDWDIELEHPWGLSEVGGMRRIQYTLNRIIGQIVDNVLLTNRVRVKADTDAVDNKTWDLITQNPNGMYVRKRTGRAFDYEPPINAIPQFILEFVNLLISSMDLVTGLTDVTQGKMPSKATSGVAIEGLQAASQSIIRLEARAYEDFLERIFQQVVALIWQYVTNDRLLAILGPGQEFQQFEFIRQALTHDDEDQPLVESAWQDFVFKVVPGTSLSSSRIQRGVLALNLHKVGLIPGVEVLRAADWPDPEVSVEAARAERAEQQGQIQVKPERPHRATEQLMPMPGVGRRSQIP